MIRFFVNLLKFGCLFYAIILLMMAGMIVITNIMLASAT